MASIQDDPAQGSAGPVHVDRLAADRPLNSLLKHLAPRTKIGDAWIQLGDAVVLALGRPVSAAGRRG